MKTIKNIAYLLMAAYMLTGCAKEVVPTKHKAEVPAIYENESILLHPDYLAGKAKLGYTLLKDIDGSGDWDLAVRVSQASTEKNMKAYFKKGFGPSQGGGNVEFVDSSFFRPYE